MADHVDIDLSEPAPSRPLPFEERRDPDAPVTRADLANLQQQSASLHLRIGAVETELRNNTNLTADVRMLLEAAKAGLRVLGWIGSAAQWAAKIAAAVGAIYAAIQLMKHGGGPK